MLRDSDSNQLPLASTESMLMCRSGIWHSWFRVALTSVVAQRPSPLTFSLGMNRRAAKVQEVEWTNRIGSRGGGGQACDYTSPHHLGPVNINSVSSLGERHQSPKSGPWPIFLCSWCWLDLQWCSLGLRLWSCWGPHTYAALIHCGYTLEAWSLHGTGQCLVEDWTWAEAQQKLMNSQPFNGLQDNCHLSHISYCAIGAACENIFLPGRHSLPLMSVLSLVPSYC